MKKWIWGALLLSLMLMSAPMTAAQAATITVEGVESEAREEELNVSVQGVITFQAREPFGGISEVICNKTMNGHISRVTIGTLVLGGNAAGIISEVIVGGCRGGTAEARAITRAAPVRLSWISIEPVRANGRRVELDGTEAKFLISVAGGLSECSYNALLVGRANAGAGDIFRENLELTFVRLNGAPVRLGGIFCPETNAIRMIGRLTIIKPAAVIRVRL